MVGMWKFKKNEDGQVGVIFALALVPLLGFTSAAVDYSKLTRERNAISIALDAAVLAAANNNSIVDSEKDDYAEAHFIANYNGKMDLTLVPGLESDRVRLSAEGDLKLAFGNLVGIKNPKLSDSSAAVIANENTICLLALNETASESILFDGGISYTSPTCAVYSNSVNSSAIVSRSYQIPSAKSFCAVGGANGDFSPYAKGECATVEDPYEGTLTPEIPEVCTTPLNELVVLKDNAASAISEEQAREEFRMRLDAALTVLQETESLSAAVEAFFSYETTPIYDADLNANIDISENRTGSDVDIKPGVFCGGLTVDGINVDFLPGEYIIKNGPLSFINGAEAIAEDVTFILSGTGAVLNVQSESSLDLKAPSTGVRSGLAVMEATDASAPSNRTVEEKTSLIAEGGSLQVLGTIYLPNQKLQILGQNTSIGSMAPATSFIADTLHISGGVGSKMNIDVDHVEAGVPPILPRAEDGARLVE